MEAAIDGLRSLVHANLSGERVSHWRLLCYIIFLFVFGAIISVCVKKMGKKAIGQVIKTFGVRVKRLARTVKEIERKTFHVAGLSFDLYRNHNRNHDQRALTLTIQL